MPKVVHNALDAATIRSLALAGAPGRHADGGGLYLCVMGPRHAVWSLRYSVAGRRREMGLGTAIHPAPEPGKVIVGVTLAKARSAAQAARMALAAGKDPIAEREAHEAARAAEAEKAAEHARTFRAAFEGWLEDHGPAMKTERQRVLVRGLMKLHVFPHIGDKPVAEITANDVAKALRPIWRTKPETALRARIRCEAVFAWAKGHGWRQGDNPATWKNNLDQMLGRQGADARAEHHRAMDWRDIPAFMARLRQETSMSAIALRWTILTAARTNETLGATWAEIDMQAPGGPVWVIPGARMKMGAEHRVPLNAEALAILADVARFRDAEAEGGGFLFPGGAGTRGGRVAGGREGALAGGLSSMALLALLRRLNVADKTTTHGLRSSFRDWVSECTATPEAVAEMALAHAVGSEVRRAYARSDLLEKRRPLMAAWGAFCAKDPIAEGANVVQIPARLAR